MGVQRIQSGRSTPGNKREHEIETVAKIHEKKYHYMKIRVKENQLTLQMLCKM
jgi:hypothetical protein